MFIKMELETDTNTWTELAKVLNLIVNILDLNISKRFCSGISKKRAVFQSRLVASYPAFVTVGCNESVEMRSVAC